MTVDALSHFYEYAEYPVESEEYETYLNIYLTIKRLFISKKYTVEDIHLLENYLEGYSYREIANIMNLDRRYVSKRMRYVLLALSNELINE